MCWRIQPFLGLTGILIVSIIGCTTDTGEISLTSEPQSGTLYLALSDPHALVVDSGGRRLRMPDGLQIAMDGYDFESIVRPLLSSQYPEDPQALVQAHATFRLTKDTLVVDVIQAPDGSTSESSRTYWVVKIIDINSADWH